MSRTVRRFEVLSPLRFNDGQPVSDDLIAKTLIDLEERFSAVSCETQTIRGHRRHEGQPFRDNLIRVFVDIPDLPENRQFFAQYKDQLKRRFQQLDIWMTTYLIEVLCVTRSARLRAFDGPIVISRVVSIQF